MDYHTQSGLTSMSRAFETIADMHKHVLGVSEVSLHNICTYKPNRFICSLDNLYDAVTMMAKPFRFCFNCDFSMLPPSVVQVNGLGLLLKDEQLCNTCMCIYNGM